MDDITARDLKAGIPLSDLTEGAMVPGVVDGEEAILLRVDDALYAVGGLCTHYHAKLCDGLLTGTAVRCPMHHSEFDVRTGEALCAPALDALSCWRVEKVGDRAVVRERIVAAPRTSRPIDLQRIVIIGGGAAGLAAADMLRRQGFAGALTIISAEADPPIDRPNLSKDFLAGNAPADWMPLRPEGWYAERHIELLLNRAVRSIDAKARTVVLADGTAHPFDALLLATGAEPIELAVPGAASGQVHMLRSFDDSRAIVATAASAKRALVIGSSFIGLEVAASLTGRGIEVHVVAPETVPMQRVLGPELGRFVRKLHETHGVVFHLNTTVKQVDGQLVTLVDGTALQADLIVAGVGVRPRLALAQQAGLAIDRGVSVDEFLQSSVPGIFAAGDIARWPDVHTGQRIRVEHWALAQRQGQVAALNMLGRRQRFDAVPFFWSQHYDVAIQYVGHAEQWDRIESVLDARDCRARYTLAGKILATVTIGRDRESLGAERALELAAPRRSAEQVDAQLDDALAMTFPASDPLAVDPPNT
jgi:NADPH-dependent 2,4-dienoyl-CoA reductase/sulfur reductase-like enzyme/nitrite reductase/ring-hydroxylating ferredoxin subunit